MKTLQEFVNILDSENAVQHWKKIFLFLLIGCLFVSYNLFEFSNFKNPEAMDIAQLARNISEGKGYVTDNIRISSIALVEKQHNGDSLTQGNHPDIVNPPLYPFLLAGLFKLSGIHFNCNDNFYIFMPEVVIAIFNQILFLISLWLTYSIARKIFNLEIALFSTILLLFNDMVWKFSISGLPNMLSLTLILFLFKNLITFRLENIIDIRKPLDEFNPPNGTWIYLRCALIGLILGALCLTQYSLGWLILPVTVFIFSTLSGKRRTLASLPISENFRLEPHFLKEYKFGAIFSMLLIFTALTAPWIWRNINVSGLPFGLATYAPIVETSKLTGTFLERVSTADILASYGPEQREYINKLRENLPDIIEKDIPTLGGTWLTIAFMAGIFLPFARRGANSARFLLIVSLCMTAIIQAMTKTYLSQFNGPIHSENLLFIYTPLVIIFGSAFIFFAIDQIQRELPSLRQMLIWFTGIICSLPMILTILPPKAHPLAWPPYHPQTIEKISSLFSSQEALMSDMPWAVSWYGKQTAFWLPLDADEEFTKINSDSLQIKGIYLTQVTLERPLLDCYQGADQSWSEFVLRRYTRKEIPLNFPFRNVMLDMYPEQILLADMERWRPTIEEE